MAMSKAQAKSHDFVSLSFDSLRNLTSPGDKVHGRRVYAGQMPANSVIDLPTNENVRSYLVEAEGKKRKARTQVHRAIRETLENEPGDFAFLNGGIVIVARDIKTDEKAKKFHLLGPSIINGSQTQGVLREFYQDYEDRGEEPGAVFVSYQLLVIDDDDLVAEVSIARNYQNDVKALSIVGRRGRLEDLEKALRRTYPDEQIRKHETDYVGVPTEKLLQVITALIPERLWIKSKPKEKGAPNKVYTYSMKAKCLKEFDKIYQIAKGDDDSVDEDTKAICAELYQFYLDIAGEAWALYLKWKQHQGFIGTGIKNAVTRDDDGKTIKEVQDGMVFPILSALSAFATKDVETGRWQIRPPSTFDERRLIESAKRAYIEIAQSNPWNMGKSRACYTQCYEVTSIYRDIAISQEQAAGF